MYLDIKISTHLSTTHAAAARWVGGDWTRRCWRMASTDSFGAKGTLEVGDQSYEIYRLSAVRGDGVPDDAVDSLPYSLKILLENLLRTEDGVDITADDILALAGWDAEAEPDKEIQFTPARVIMQDFTGVPCIVDLATMREPTSSVRRRRSSATSRSSTSATASATSSCAGVRAPSPTSRWCRPARASSTRSTSSTSPG
jgi:hypothetical protein